MKNPATEQETNKLNINILRKDLTYIFGYGLLKTSEYFIRFVFASVSECEVRSFLFCQKRFNTQTERRDLIGSETTYTA